MNLPELCIRRPVMTTLLMATFLIFGLFAFKQLPVAALPRVDFPTINVSARLPGASPETMASSVAAPLEREFASISGITSMSSVSQQGSTSITLQFDLNRNIDGAALDVQAALSATVRRLPPELPAPPSFRKVNPADQPVLFMVLTSATKPLYEVHEFGENILQQQISQLPGVAQVNIFGAQKYAVRVRVNPDAVSARGLSLADVRSAIAAANSNSPVGTLNGSNQRLTLGATGYAWQGSPDLAGHPVTQADKKGEVDPDEVLLREAMFGRFNNSWSYFNAADAMTRTGAPDLAVVAMQGATIKYPADAALWTGLGIKLSEHDRGVSPAALFAFNRGIELWPDHPGPVFFLGLAYVRMGQLAEARPYWVRAVALTPATTGYREVLVAQLDWLDRRLAEGVARQQQQLGVTPAPAPAQ